MRTSRHLSSGVLLAVLGISLFATVAEADDVRPVQVLIRELLANALPSPRLPAGSRPVGPRTLIGGFSARAAWTVAGTVTHFGHRHFRQNRCAAIVTVVPADGSWKIRSLEVLDAARLR